LPAKLRLRCVRCTPSQPRAARQLLQSRGVPERRFANKFAPTVRRNPLEACPRSCDCGVSDASHRSLALLGSSYSHAVCQRGVSRTSSLLQAGRNPLERGLPAKLRLRCVRCTPSQPRAARQLLQSCGVPERRFANKFAPMPGETRWSKACPRSCDCGVSDAPHRSLAWLGSSNSHAVCQRAVSRTSSLLQVGRNLLERGLPAKLTLGCVRCTPSQLRAARQLLQSCDVPERRFANKFAPTGRAKPVGGLPAKLRLRCVRCTPSQPRAARQLLQ